MDATTKGTAPVHDGRPAFDEWCVVELMGHRRVGARVSEAQIAGSSFIRLEIPREHDDQCELYTTQFYNPSAVYCITPTTKQIARALAKQFSPPVSRYDLPELPPTALSNLDQPRDDGGDYEDDELDDEAL